MHLYFILSGYLDLDNIFEQLLCSLVHNLTTTKFLSGSGE